jgi:phosphotransferase system enzyme I (PtsI)
MKEIRGIPASPGIAKAPAFVFVEEEQAIPSYPIERCDVSAEWERFLAAVRRAEEEITILRDRAASEMGKEHSLIFDSHLLMLNDPDYHEQISGRLSTSLRNIEHIIMQLESEIVEQLKTSDDQYLRERSIDIRDISKRVLSHLLKRKRRGVADIDTEVILVAHDLLPSDAIQMDKRRIKGIAMDVGGKTSHSAILARAFGIPAVLGLSDATKNVADGEIVMVDGTNGVLVLDPDDASIRRYEGTLASRQEREAALLAEAGLPPVTLDGHAVTLKANIEIPEEAETALRYGAEGIGLYRSEFLFLGIGGKSSEEAQYKAYRRVAEAMGGRPVTIRSFDLGGDKMLDEQSSINEKNPLLGWRAVRYCLSRRSLFLAQLRAILRASAHGKVRIMFPMISGVEELDLAREVLSEAMAELRSKGQAFDESVEVGCMIEIPSAAMTADILARRCDFFSIGTNDLIQYAIAVDRGNEKTAYLYQPFHPGVLRLIDMTIKAAHEAGIKVAMCGELAGDPMAAPILLGMGLDEFSMSAVSIPEVKRRIRGLRLDAARELAREALALPSYKDIEALIRERVGERA